MMPPSAGRIFIRNREIQLADYSVRMAHDLSIETVYQDKSLAEKQPLWRNFFVGRQITNRLGFIDIKREKQIAERVLKEVNERLQFLVDVGLHYLTLDRASRTLSIRSPRSKRGCMSAR